MKKASIVLFVLFFSIIANGFAQTAVSTTPATATVVATDFFAGKWQVVFIGTPQGDVKLIANFTRKEGKLEGELKDTSDEKAEAIPIASVDESANKITFGFSAQGYDISVDLEKVDDDNLKGMMMNMFETKAVRVK
jgi:hypothetical protein